MQENVFSPAFGNRPSYLVGREGVISAFMRGLSEAPGSRLRSTVLLGQRGSGKTVLLWELADRARDTGYVVATPTIAAEGMLERIVEKIQDDGSRYVGKSPVPRVANVAASVMGFTVGLEFDRETQQGKSYAYKLTQLVRRLTAEGHGVLILVDELQANSAEVRQLVTVYQELVGEGLDVAIVMAGLPGAVSATLNDHVLTFLNRSHKETLASLSIGAVDGYYQRAFDELGIVVSQELRLEAARETNGSPYLLQLIGYNVALRVDSGGTVTRDLLEGAVAASREDYENDVCGTTLAALSDMDCKFLMAMADDGEESRMVNLAERLGVKQDYAQKYRRRLIDAGVIEVSRRGYVRYAVPLLGDYLRRDLLD